MKILKNAREIAKKLIADLLLEFIWADRQNHGVTVTQIITVPAWVV